MESKELVKNSNEVLQIIGKKIDLDNFYSISIGRNEVRLQGYYVTSLMREFKDAFLNDTQNFELSDQNYVECKFSLIFNDYTVYICVTLTDQ